MLQLDFDASNLKLREPKRKRKKKDNPPPSPNSGNTVQGTITFCAIMVEKHTQREEWNPASDFIRSRMRVCAVYTRQIPRACHCSLISAIAHHTFSCSHRCPLHTLPSAHPAQCLLLNSIVWIPGARNIKRKQVAWHPADLTCHANEEEGGKAVGGLLPGRIWNSRQG